jgi:prolyl 4-hydroxylase
LVVVTHAAITPETRNWVIACIEKGESPDSLLQTLISRGIDEEAAVAFMTRTLEARLEELKEKAATRDAPVPDPVTAIPQPLSIEWPSVIPAGSRANLDRDIRVMFSLDHPRVVLFQNFLSNAECDELIRLSRDRMQASHVIDMDSGSTRADSGRTSSGTAFIRGESPFIERIERRIEALLQWPYERGEALQILRYKVGQEYKPHYDYVDPTQPGAAPFLARGGQRVASLVMYLNTPQDGGGTNFPDAGFEIAAHKGCALYFSYDRPHPMTRSRHGGMPVRAGEKWVATKWLREAEHL